jgi:hypothetical protein
MAAAESVRRALESGGDWHGYWERAVEQFERRLGVMMFGADPVSMPVAAGLECSTD